MTLEEFRAKEGVLTLEELRAAKELRDKIASEIDWTKPHTGLDDPRQRHAWVSDEFAEMCTEYVESLLSQPPKESS